MPASPTAPPPAATTQPSFEDQVSVGYVLVPVTVRDSDGYVKNLEQKNFKLFVDDRRASFDSFEKRSDAPVSIVFLQDLSGSMEGEGKLDASREAVRYFLDDSTPEDEFAIASFAGGSTNVEVPFTNDLEAVRDALAQWEAYGTTTLHDAVAWLPEITDGGSRTKRAAVLITDGADNASTISPTGARELVRAAQVPVYVIGIDSGSPYELSREGKKANRYADVLNLLALYTGGRYFAVDGVDELKEAVVAIADDLRHQYVLGFPTSGSGRSKDHRIRVEVDRDKLKVLARQGYRGTLPPG